MGMKAPFSSLTDYARNPIVSLVIALLIVVGGIGFLTWEDIRTNRLNLRKYRMQSKVILTVTGILILLPTIYFFFFEFTDAPLAERFWSSMFQSVTPRTAGFNTVDQLSMTEVGIAITTILMLIGGSPGSTAGGMKTTTLAVMFSTSLSVFRQREHTHFFGRRIGEDVIRNAATVFMMYLTLCLMGGFLISRIENLPVLTCLYECASAIGTVGLTLGITPDLELASQLILIALMYIGRVGGLTLIFSALSGNKGNTARLPQEKLIVG